MTITATTKNESGGKTAEKTVTITLPDDAFEKVKGSDAEVTIEAFVRTLFDSLK